MNIINELADMSPNQRRALDKGLAALDAMAALWAVEIGLKEMARKISNMEPTRRTATIETMVQQGFVEGAYRHFLDHQDLMAEPLSTEENARRATGIVASWPAWKRDFALTKYSPAAFNCIGDAEPGSDDAGSSEESK